jgi:spectinomycin phosphotransferase
VRDKPAALDAALDDLGQPWDGGPFSEPARALLTRTAGQVRHLLATFDRLAACVAESPRAPAITHGEPHPANLIQSSSGTMLIDWDTVGLAPPERDLWWIATGSSEVLRRYAEATGRGADPATLACYRLRWALDDISAFVALLRSAHHHTADPEHAWRGLQSTLARAGP